MKFVQQLKIAVPRDYITDLELKITPYHELLKPF